MQLLDSTLAFVLTLAALATVVTVIMEACLRTARMRRKNLVEVMKLLNEELAGSMLNMNADERWKFFIRVVQNRAKDSIEELNPELKEIEAVQDRIAYLGREKDNLKGKIKGRIIRFFLFIRQLAGDKKRTGLHTDVSLEYMLRCLAESEPVKKATLNARDAVVAEFNRIARTYETFGSSVSASFKQYSQAWSIAIGIVLAVCANIDGVRVFQAYRADPDLAAIVIDRKDALLANYEESQKNLDEYKAALAAFETAKNELKKEKEKENGNEAELSEKQKAFAVAEAAMENQDSLKNVQSTARRAQQQIADLIALGIPIGWQCYPSCPFGDDVAAWAMSCQKCKAIPVDKREIGAGKRSLLVRIAKTLRYDFGGFVLWFMVVVGTGILIGLGAPFWFDVAKRLAQIRKGIQSASASAEYRLAGSDANGNYEKRKEIVANVLADAAAETAARKPGQGGRRAFFDGKGDDHDRVT